ncbi:MAG: hypothetical protein IKP29_06290 [Pseudobutyrivibrio sp.]|nr:hypothetical protein [Pseudobutyrivibrio sp.]
MSQSEDYLDGLLNSINKAKTDVTLVQQQAEEKQKQAGSTMRSISPDEDFFEATGIDTSVLETKTSHPYLRKVLSEEDFLRQFEEELDSDDVDVFISNFEEEIDEEERLFQKGIEKEAEPEAEPEEEDELEAEPEKEISLEPEEELEAEADEPSILDEDTPLDIPDEGEIDLSNFIEEGDEEEPAASEESQESEDDLGFSLDDMAEDVEEEPLDDSLKEFMPDEMDALDEAQFGDGEEPDLSGAGDMDLENLLEGGDDEDLLDISSLLSGDEEGPGEGGDIDESAEEAPKEAPAADDGKKKKKEKKKKEKKEKGEKKPNPILAKLALIFFGPPDEDDIAEAEEAAKKAATVEITYDEDGNPIIPDGAELDPKEKKKKEKEEKKAAKEAAKKEKEAAKKEKAKDKPAKPPKPKKEKKPKEPDNSPKIPISIIATFLVLSISIIGVVMVGMTFTGIKRHMVQAQELFDAGDYIAAYEKLNGFDLSDEKVLLLRNQARVLADLQLSQEEYEAFIAYEQYNYALDALITAVGRYEKYKDDAVEYGISEQYEAYASTILNELQSTFNLSKEDALAIYNQPNRHYYTIELRKVLRGLGYPDL